MALKGNTILLVMTNGGFYEESMCIYKDHQDLMHEVLGDKFPVIAGDTKVWTTTTADLIPNLANQDFEHCTKYMKGGGGTDIAKVLNELTERAVFHSTTDKYENLVIFSSFLTIDANKLNTPTLDFLRKKNILVVSHDNWITFTHQGIKELPQDITAKVLTPFQFRIFLEHANSHKDNTILP